MKSALEIPFKNEWMKTFTLHHLYSLARSSKPIPITHTRSNIAHTLELLHNSWQLALFDTILPINDGSDDDSVLQIQNFIEKHGYENFQILGDNTNKWKWIRYSETLEFCREKWIEVLVTTDADMINPWDTLPGILEALKHHPHVVSPVFESASPSTFQIANPLAHLSGTRWTRVDDRFKKVRQQEELIANLLASWRYTLEPVCNWVFCGETHVLNYRDDEYRTAPVFLPEFRSELSAKEEQNAGYELVQSVFWEKVYKDFFK